MSRKGSAEELQARRLRAILLLEEGYSQTEVARKLGVSSSAVSQWKQAHSQGGNDALVAQLHPGPPSRLSPKQCQRLIELLKQGPRKHGWSTELWTLPRIAELIACKFGANYAGGSCAGLAGAVRSRCGMPANATRPQSMAGARAIGLA